jgi:nucleoside kinase
MDLLVFGDTALDNFYEVDTIPKSGEASDISSSRRFYGGMGANTAVCAKKLGLDVGLVSVIGADATDYRVYLENVGVKLFLKGIFGDTTKSMFYKSPEAMISFFQKGVTEQLDTLDPFEEFGSRMPSNVKVVYMARTYLKMQKKVVGHFRDALKVYNPGYGIFKYDRVPRDMKSIMGACDIVAINHHELAHLEKIGFKLKPQARQTFIVTRGRQGASVHMKNTRIDVPAYKTQSIDSSGAGDAFNAGLIAARLKGHDIYESVKYGNACASHIVEEWGCQTNLPAWDMVVERYKRIR